MGYLPDETVAAFRGAYNLGLFFRLDSDPALHLWFGVSDIAARIPDLDVDGTVYFGGGILADIPDSLEVLLNGAAERADFTMSGIPADLTANLAADAPSVVGRRCDFGVAPLDSRWQMIGHVVSLWVGTADFWAEEQPPQPDVGKPRLRRLTLSTMTGNVSRALSAYETWTDRDQVNLSAGDEFCDRVSRYFPGQIVRWPRL